MIEQVYTLKEVAELSKLHIDTVRKAAAAGRLVTIRLGKSVRVRAADLKTWLEKGDTPCQPEKSPRAARPGTAPITKPTPDGATGLAWENRLKGKRS